MRDHIVAEIRRIATATGQAPGQTMFASETGIAAHLWRGKLWARWGDALIEAGYGPNEWTQRLETDQVLLKIIQACRHYSKLPTKSEFELYRKIDPTFPSYSAITRHFVSRSGLVETLAKRVAGDLSNADIDAMLASVPRAAADSLVSKTKLVDGFVYLIKSGEFYKIGRSDDIERRVKEIRIALPDKATLIHSIRTDDPPGIEAYWHNRFANKRANGEWFKLSSLEISAFKKRKYQ